MTFSDHEKALDKVHQTKLIGRTFYTTTDQHSTRGSNSERNKSVTSQRGLRSDDKMHCGSLGSILEQKKGNVV